MAQEKYMKKVSVIVPVYNVEAFLPECLDSLLAQNYPNLELLVVDDGATDGSGAICDEYAARDGRITVIHQKNMGLSGARNTGLEQADGDYIMFVDSDDYVMPDYVGHMVAAIEQEEADIVICRFYNCNEQEDGTYRPTPCVSEPQQYCLSGSEILPRRFDEMKMYYGVAWNKIFRREVLSHVRFPEGRTCEDVWASLDYYLRCNKVICLGEMLYCYRNRMGSISQSSSLAWVESQMEWLERELQYFYEQNQPENLVYPARHYIALFSRNRRRGLRQGQEREKYWNMAIRAVLSNKELSSADKIKYRVRQLQHRIGF
jgi:glycosyltransferase involved in cell wall biosynthesis